MAWTTAQQQAIDSRGKNLLVSAAAGSGKTAVLVQRIIDIVLNEKVDVQNLLIVTFTNAAAAEMKERIQKKLMDRMLENPEESHYLIRQIQNLHRASISTMHSFCIDILRRNFHMLDLDPSFKIANNSMVSIMKTQAMDNLFDEKYEADDSEFLSLVDTYGGTRDDKKLSDLIDKVYNFIQSQPYPLKWLEEEAECFDITSLDELQNSKWMRVIKDDIRIKLDEAYEASKKAIELCKLDGGPLPYLAAIEDDMLILANLQNSLKVSFDDFCKELVEVKHSRFSTISKKMKEDLDIALIDEVKAIRDTDIKASGIKAIQKSIKNISESFQLEDIKNLYPIIKSLYKTVVRFDEIYSELKLSNSVLDFSDLEHYALRLLENESVRQDLKDKYIYIFFDEYQDSNIVQETIINAIKREDNLFFVGDVKQSIYRFRLADPTLFIGKYHDYARSDGPINHRIDLSNNFRSRPAILEFINDIFETIMSEDLGEVNYDDSAKLIPGMDFPQEKDKVELVVLENHKIEEDEDLENADMDNPELEAMYVATRIKELLGKEYFNPKAKEFQKISYRDIVILMRSPKSSISAFEEILKDDRIPCYVDYNASYYDVLEIKLFIDLLKIVDNIHQDEPLLAVMNSSIGGFTLDEIIEIRIAYKYETIYQALLSYADDIESELSKKIRVFLDKIKTYRFQEKLQRLDEFLWYLMIETGYYSDLAAMPGGEMRQENLKALLDKAVEFQSNTTNGLFNFLHYIDKLLKDKGDTQEAKALSESEDRVRIMSIHKSKGLEFPVVFVCGLSKGFNTQDFKQDIMLHNNLGIGPKYVDIDKNVFRESLPKTAIKIQAKKEMLSEELRILYVALTRAIDTLIMVGSVKNIETLANKVSKSKSTNYLMSQSNYLSWMLIALYKHEDAGELRSYAEREVMENEQTFYKSSFKLSLVAKHDLLKNSRKERQDIQDIESMLRNFETKGYEELNAKVTDLANQRFNYSYPYEDKTKQVSKTSATMIAKSLIDAQKNPVFLQTMPRFMQDVKTFSAAQKGTLIHFAMQSLNFNHVESIENIQGQLDMMLANELITDEEVKILDAKVFVDFFNSPLGKRMLASKDVKRENAFMLKKDDIVISGVIDSYFEENGQWVLVDYKTDYMLYSSKNEKSEAYRPQLEIYKEALESSTNKKVKSGYIYLFDIQEAIEII